MGIFGNKSEALQSWDSESKVSEYIPYSHHVTRNIIATRDGAYVAIWKVAGRSHDTASQTDVFKWLDELHTQLLGSTKIDPRLQLAFWSYVHRRKVNEYPEAEFPSSFARSVNEKYSQNFTNATSRVNDLYIAIVVREQMDGVLKAFAAREKLTADDRVALQQRSIKALNSVNHQFSIALKPYRGELLGIEDVWDEETQTKYAYCSILRWLKYLTDGIDEPVPVCHGRIYSYLSTYRPLFSTFGATGENRYPRRTRRFAMLEMMDVSRNTTEPGQLNRLLKSEHEFVLCQSFTALTLQAASGALDMQQRMLKDSNDPAESIIRALTTARDRLESGEIIFGDHHLSLLAYGDTEAAVEESIDIIRTTLTSCRMVTTPVDLALEAAYWAQLPGNWCWRPRPAPVSSENFLSWSSFHNFLSGKPSGNPWGPAVTILRTLSHTPLYFSFHVSGHDDDDFGKMLLGNCLVLGKSGEGKTATVCFLLTMAQKFNPTTIIFDKDCGTMPWVLAHKGRYYSVRKGRRTGWNPLRALDPNNKEHMTFLTSFVKKLVSLDGRGLDVDDENAIQRALDVVMSTDIPREDRRLGILLQNMPKIERQLGDRASTSERLAKWCGKGENGWLFDNDDDTLDFEGCKTFGFDVTDFIDGDEKERLAAIMMYLNFRTDALQDGRRVIRLREEFHKLFEDPGIEAKAKDEAKTDRKKNTINIWSSQEPGDAINSRVGSTLIQQTATLMLLANDRAVAEEYINVLKLTPREFEVMHKFPTGGRQVLIKQGTQCAVASMDLGKGWKDEMRIFSGTPETAELAEACVEQYGAEPEDWMPHFIKAMEDKENGKAVR